MEMKKYTVTQTFTIFGDPCEESFDDRDAAEKYAQELAEGIADGYGNRDGDYIISVAAEQQVSGVGMSSEVDFAKNIEWELCDGETWDDEYARIKTLRADLIDDILSMAIEIIENEEE